jgi:hypothetical protein
MEDQEPLDNEPLWFCDHGKAYGICTRCDGLG